MIEEDGSGRPSRSNGDDGGFERNAEPTIAVRVLRSAAERGIISLPQLDELIAFASSAEPPERAAAEVRRGLNAVTVAYWSGALAVLFALGWFLVDRWRGLGAIGVLAVSLAYAIVFSLVAVRLGRAGFHRAAAFATLLVVGMVPIMTWSVLSLAGFWPEPPRVYPPQVPGGGPQPSDLTRWIPIDIATLAASLIAIRLVRFDVLALPAALAWTYLPFHVMPAIVSGGVPIAAELEGFTALAVGTSLLAVGYLVEQRQARPRHSPDTDYARWIYLVALVALVAAAAQIWDKHRTITPHLVLAFSAANAGIALRLRRRSFLLAAALGFVSYLAWLAFDVFRRTLGFPIVLAGFGLAVILLAVWLQRRFPRLLARMDGDRGPSRRTLPGGVLPFALSCALAIALLVAEVPRARVRHDVRVQREREALARVRADSLRAVPRPP